MDLAKDMSEHLNYEKCYEKKIDIKKSFILNYIINL